MVKHNNVIPNSHFHKDWERFVRTWFDQAPQKKQRRLKRQAKAAKVFPRPVAGRLRPVVTPPSVRYNSKLKLGRGFTFAELKAARINRKEAQGVGISVDHRRRNKSDKSFQQNVARLKTYKSKLILFPRSRSRNAKRKIAEKTKAIKPVTTTVTDPKSGKTFTRTYVPRKKSRLSFVDSTKHALSRAHQLAGPLLRLKRPRRQQEWRGITPGDRRVRAFRTLRCARANARLVGRDAKRAKARQAAAVAAAAKK